jgi:phosphoribosylformylglycinamidine cyclo-ligase
MMFFRKILQLNTESYDAAVPEDLIYSGQVKLTDAVENSQSMQDN